MDADTQLGPLTTEKRLKEVEELVEKTKQEGAKVLLGGKRPAGFNKGFFYEPTIFDNVKDDYTAYAYFLLATCHYERIIDEKKDTNMAVRVFVSDPGTPKAETCLAFCKIDEQEGQDTLIEMKTI